MWGANAHFISVIRARLPRPKIRRLKNESIRNDRGSCAIARFFGDGADFDQQSGRILGAASNEGRRCFGSDFAAGSSLVAEIWLEDDSRLGLERYVYICERWPRLCEPSKRRGHG